ncbi:hypothetical protein R80B4_01198 [Fibrobacteres bacterium R8-0-B4]
MLTVLLWITLIASIILLIAVASPITASCKAVYREDGRDTELHAVIYYIHPLIFRTEYAAQDGEFKIFILGFEKKQGGGKDDYDNHDTDKENIGTDSTNTDSIDNEDTGANGINTDGINTDGINTDNINTEDTNTDNINTEDTDTSNDTATKEKKISLLSKIKSKINAIKSNKVYKILADKPLREKLLRWLKLSAIRVIRIISFEKLKLHIRIGLQDPARLGKIYGYFSAAQSALALQHYHIDLDMEPVFMERCLSIDSDLKIKTTLSTILWQLIAITATFPYLRLRKVIKRS